MYICICNSINESDLIRLIENNKKSIKKQISFQCGKCFPEIKKIEKQIHEKNNKTYPNRKR